MYYLTGKGNTKMRRRINSKMPAREWESLAQSNIKESIELRCFIGSTI
jgi:hypothetical protein